EVEGTPHLRGRPQVLLGSELGGTGRAVHLLDAREPDLPGGRRLGQRRVGRHHGIEERQRQGHAHTAQHRASRNVLLRIDHRSPLLSPSRREDLPRRPCRRRYWLASVVSTASAARVIWNAGLLITPRMN